MGSSKSSSSASPSLPSVLRTNGGSSLSIDTTYDGDIPDTSNLSLTQETLTNYLSHKQCCVEQITGDALEKLQIGSKEARCKIKESVFSNILLEILACTTINRDSIVCSLVTPISVVPNGTSITFYINGIQVSDTMVKFSPGFGTYVIDNVNNYDSVFDIFVSGNSAYLNSNITSDYDIYALTDYPGNPIINISVDSKITAGNTCLDEEDVCEISEYLNKVCETC